MGLIRATYKAGKAAAKGASGAEIAKEGAKGFLPMGMGKIVDRIATPENVSRVQSGINNVVDNGRAGTFSASTSPFSGEYSSPSTDTSSAFDWEELSPSTPSTPKTDTSPFNWDEGKY